MTAQIPPVDSDVMWVTMLISLAILLEIKAEDLLDMMQDSCKQNVFILELTELMKKDREKLTEALKTMKTDEEK